jgi:hypothetical protein
LRTGDLAAFENKDVITMTSSFEGWFEMDPLDKRVYTVLGLPLTMLLGLLVSPSCGQSVQDLAARCERSSSWDKSVFMVSDIKSVTTDPAHAKHIEHFHHVIYCGVGDSMSWTLVGGVAEGGPLPEGPNFVKRLLVLDGRWYLYSFAKGKKITQLFTQADSPHNRISRLTEYNGPLARGYLFGDDNDKTVWQEMKESPDLSVRPAMEKVDGIACNVIEADTSDGHFTLWVSTAQNDSAIKLVLTKGANDRFGEEPLSAVRASPQEGDQAVRWLGTYTARKLDHIAQFYVPSQAEFDWTLVLKNKKSVTYTAAYVRTAIELNPDINKHKCFQLDVPDGTPVVDLDRQKSGVRYEWKGGKIIAAVDDGVQSEIDSALPQALPN